MVETGAPWLGSSFVENCAAMVGAQRWAGLNHRRRRLWGGRNAGWKGSNFDEKCPAGVGDAVRVATISPWRKAGSQSRTSGRIAPQCSGRKCVAMALPRSKGHSRGIGSGGKVWHERCRSSREIEPGWLRRKVVFGDQDGVRMEGWAR